MTDPRYLDASLEEIVSAYWEEHYAKLRDEGRSESEEFEDTDFDSDEVQRLMAEHPDDWMDVLTQGEANV